MERAHCPVFRGRLGVILSNRGKPIGVGIGGFEWKCEVHHVVYHHLITTRSVLKYRLQTLPTRKSLGLLAQLRVACTTVEYRSAKR